MPFIYAAWSDASVVVVPNEYEKAADGQRRKEAAYPDEQGKARVSASEADE
jgi:hypothetical protein